MIDTEIKVTPQIAAEHGLTPEEYARTQKILGRDPSFTELGIFSVMWSEHCSYKSSRVHLKRLPTRGTHVVQGPGENAGVVDIGDGMVAVFKIESHNHPSFVEPFQGAATGVGGILRDIFTMGARPIAVMDSLRFGPVTSGVKTPEVSGALAAGLKPRPSPADHRADGGRAMTTSPFKGDSQDVTAEEIARNRHILDGVIRGIGFYGNCFGVPTVGGEVVFEPCYSNNPLVNALALGICRREELFFAKARGAGNPVIYVGAKTGRDGIHGASLLASAEFSEESQQKRPNVQMGDPFMEKLLLEACLEAMRTGAVVAIQDMGAAGLTSSSSEMASRGGLGIEIDLARVPQRETGMTPYEIMLSESQERMLLVAARGREREVFDVFHKWGLDAVEIGRVTEDGILRVLNHGEVAAAIPAHAIAEEGPRYERPIARPDATAEAGAAAAALAASVRLSAAGADLTGNFLRLLASPTIASKHWITEQYDSMVQTNTTFGPGAGDAAVVRLKESKRALALATDGNGRWGFLAPRLGAMHAVAEAARNVACSGARPIAATNCLNFGNPEKPEVMWQFSEAIDGIAEACRVLETPITGGNVSFYNETLGKAIYPTPVLGVLGLMEDAECALGAGFRNEGDLILVLDGDAHSQGVASGAEASSFGELTAGLKPRSSGAALDGMSDVGAKDGAATPSILALPGSQDELKAAATITDFASSEYARTIHGVVAGMPPAIDLAAEKRLIDCLVALAGERAVLSAHDVSDGGLAVSVAEACFGRDGLGAEIAIDAASVDDFAETALFGERGARAVVSVAPASLARLNEIAAQYHVRAQRIGTVTRGDFRIQYRGAAVIQGSIESFRRVWSEALPKAIENA
jgi:phosphoribosylformylglycinamidine (FGAM) synthase-like enzyme